MLILDEPTRGIDVGAKAEVHAMIGELAAEGIGIILISSDLPEVLAMSDRVLVMREGRQMAIFDRDEATQEIGHDRGHGPGAIDQRRSRGVNWLQRHVRPEQIREFSLLLLIIVAVLIFGSLIDGYYTSRTFNRIASSVAIITVVAVGQTLVVLTRNIDLSVGSIVGCTAYFAGTLLAAHHGMPPVARRADRGRARRRHGRDQRRARRLGPRAVDHRHARHARDLPRHPRSTSPAPRRSPPTACRPG